MWLKKLFTTQPVKPNSQSDASSQIEKSVFETEETSQESSPLIDQSPDLRYEAINQSLQKTKLPFPHHLMHQKEIIFFFGEKSPNSFECRSAFCNFIFCDLLFSDKQIYVCPNVFSFEKGTKALSSSFLEVPYGHVEKAQIKESKKDQIKLFLTLKDSRSLIITHKSCELVRKIHGLLLKFGMVNGINKLYAFKYRKNYNQISNNIKKGWEIYDIRTQFARQGVLKYTCLQEKNKDFKYGYKIINNFSYQISSTYPAQFIVPFSISLEELNKSAKFRTRERVPALTYFYEYSTNRFSTLFRCSQIKTGLMGFRCQQDIKIIKQIAQSASYVSSCKKPASKNNLNIYDARGYYAALGNMLAGKGYEKEDIYNCEVKFLNIPNIHAVRDSYQRVKSADTLKEETYQVLASSGWIQFLFLILTGAKEIARDLMCGKNVLVHCSDGWDRTSQLSSLAQVMLDPYYRTFEGIAVLIEKDWRHFGHKFRERTGQFHPTSYHPYQKSPVFIQFLDCLYQLMCQFPLSFEYSHTFLEFLGFHCDSCVYGTFLTNTVREASQIKVQKETISIWTDTILHKNRDSFLNPFYRQDLNIGFLNVSLQRKNMRVWRQHLFYQKNANQVAELSFMREKEINKALRQQFYNNQNLIQELKSQLKQKDN